MEKKFDLDDELEMLLDDQLMKEAELLEKVLFADDSFEDYQETSEERKASFEKLVNRLKAEGIYRGDTVNDNVSKENASKNHTSEDADKEDIEKVIGKENSDNVNNEKEYSESTDKVVAMRVAEKTSKNKVSRKFGRSLVKVASIVIVSGLCVFAASMTSEANRNYFLNNIRVLSGNDTRVVESNDVNNDLVSSDEYAAIECIEKELNVEIPEFLYRPESFEFRTYEVESIAEFGWMEYSYKNGIITFRFDKNDKESFSEMSGLHGDKIEEIQMIYENIIIELVELVDKEEECSNYYANWTRNNVNYSISGRIELVEIKKMLEEMVY